MALKKQYLQDKSLCKVTFTLEKQAVPDAKTVHVVGEFNNWDKKVTPLKKQKNGSFTVTLTLESGKEYQYRYLIDEEKWENDWQADKYLPSPTAYCDNSVVIV